MSESKKSFSPLYRVSLKDNYNILNIKKTPLSLCQRPSLYEYLYIQRTERHYKSYSTCEYEYQCMNPHTCTCTYSTLCKSKYVNIMHLFAPTRFTNILYPVQTLFYMYTGVPKVCQLFFFFSH